MKRKFVKDYILDGKDEKSFQYAGDYFTFTMASQKRKKRAIIQILAAAMELFLLVLAGFLNSPGTYQVYIVLPCVFMLLPLYYYLCASLRFYGIPQRMERHVYEESLHRLIKSVTGIFFLNLFAVLADAGFLLLNYSKINAKKEILFLIILAVLAVVNYVALRYHTALHKLVLKQENPYKRSKSN